MENPNGTSFIPKNPTRATVRPRGVRRVFILTYVAAIFFFGTIVAVVGVFIWNVTIDTKLEEQKSILSDERDSFDQAGLESVRELSTRLDTAKGLLEKQVSILSIFDALEKTTLDPVQLLEFKYEKKAEDLFSMELSVNATDFNESLFQREILTGKNILVGSVISEITYTDPESEGESGSDSESGSGSVADSGVAYTLTKGFSVSDIAYKAPLPTVSTSTTTVAPTSDTSTQTSGTSSDPVVDSNNNQ